MPSQPILSSLDHSLRQVEVMKGAIERLESIDRAEYPDLALDLAKEAMNAAAVVRNDMSGLVGRFGGHVLRRRRKVGA